MPAHVLLVPHAAGAIGLARVYLAKQQSLQAQTMVKDFSAIKGGPALPADLQHLAKGEVETGGH